MLTQAPKYHLTQSHWLRPYLEQISTLIKPSTLNTSFPNTAQPDIFDPAPGNSVVKAILSYSGLAPNKTLTFDNGNVKIGTKTNKMTKYNVCYIFEKVEIQGKIRDRKNEFGPKYKCDIRHCKRVHKGIALVMEEEVELQR